MDRLKTFLWWCAGINEDILKRTPTESSKYFGIGATVFFTGVFASLAAGYSLFTVFDSIYVAIAFGILWGLMIFNLDRYIVSSMRKRGTRTSEFGMAIPRIVLALIISIVIARPLELKIFEKEIKGELAMMQQEDITRKEALIRGRLQNENEILKSEIVALESEVNLKEQKRDELLLLAQQEADGTGGSQRRNAGPIYKIKKADADRADAELRELKERNTSLVNEKLEKIRSNEQITQENIKSFVHTDQDGLASRLEAMDRLVKKSEAINIAHIFILLLFISIEIAPIMVKLITPKGPYDFQLQEEEYVHEARYFQRKAEINASTRKATENLPKEEADYVADKLRVSLHKS